MTSYYDWIQEIYLENPDVTPSELWILLCKKFKVSDTKDSEEKTRSTLFPQPPSYRGLANQFIDANPLYAEKDNAEDSATAMMQQINEALKQNDFAFDSNDAFMNLLKTFLTCHPDYEDVFDLSVKRKLNIKAYMPYKILDDKLNRPLSFTPDTITNPLSQKNMAEIHHLKVLFELRDLGENEYRLLNNLIIRISRAAELVPGLYKEFIITGRDDEEIDDELFAEQKSKYNTLKLDQDFWDRISDRTIQRVADTLVVLINQKEPGIQRFGLNSFLTILPRISQDKISKISKLLIKPLFDLLENDDCPQDIADSAAQLITKLLMRQNKKDSDETIHTMAMTRYKRFAKEETQDINILLETFLRARGSAKVVLPLEYIIKTSSLEITKDVLQALINKVSLERGTDEHHFSEDLTEKTFEADIQRLNLIIQKIENNSQATLEIKEQKTSSPIREKNDEELMKQKLKYLSAANDIIKENGTLPLEMKNTVLDLLIQHMNERLTRYVLGRAHQHIAEHVRENTIPQDKLADITQKIKEDFETSFSRQNAVISRYAMIYDLLSRLPSEQRPADLVEGLMQHPIIGLYSQDRFEPKWDYNQILGEMASQLPLPQFQEIFENIANLKLPLPNESKTEKNSEQDPVLHRLQQLIENERKALTKIDKMLYKIVETFSDEALKNAYDIAREPTVGYLVRYLLKMNPENIESKTLGLLDTLSFYQHMKPETAEAIASACLSVLSNAENHKKNANIGITCGTVINLSSKCTDETKFKIADTLMDYAFQQTSTQPKTLLNEYNCLTTLLAAVPDEKLTAFTNKLVDHLSSFTHAIVDCKCDAEAIILLLSRLKKDDFEAIVDRLVARMQNSEDSKSSKLAFKILSGLSSRVNHKAACKMVDYLLLQSATNDNVVKTQILTSLEKLIDDRHFIYKINDERLIPVIDYILQNTDWMPEFYNNSKLLGRLYALAPEKLLAHIEKQTEEKASATGALDAFISYCHMIADNIIPFVPQETEEKGSVSPLRILEKLIDKMTSIIDNNRDFELNRIGKRILNALAELPDNVFEVQPYKKLLDKIFNTPDATGDLAGIVIDSKIIKKSPEDKVIQLFQNRINEVKTRISHHESKDHYYYSDITNMYNTVFFESLLKHVPEKIRMHAIDKLLDDLSLHDSKYQSIREQCLTALINSLSPSKQNYYLFAVFPNKMDLDHISAQAQTVLLDITKEVSTQRILAHEIGTKVTTVPSILLDYLGGSP